MNYKKVLSTPIVICIIAYLASCILKILLFPSYFSTDLEVHRNWLAITCKLPSWQWYIENTSEWTMDYPPLFGWFQYLTCILAHLVLNPSQYEEITQIIPSSNVSTYIELIQNHTIDKYSPSWNIIIFMRSTVILSDMVLFYGVYEMIKSWPSKKTTTEIVNSFHKQLVVYILIIFNFGLLLVDHVHFQYNGMLNGLLLLSMAKIRQEKCLMGAFYYCILILSKHIYLYVAPCYFIYLLRHYCFKKKSMRKHKRSLSDIDGEEIHVKDDPSTFSLQRFLILASLVLLMLILSFLSIIHLQSPILPQILQVFGRLFPTQRGLVHAYWAPNLWALYCALEKFVCLILKPASSSNLGSMTGGLVQPAQFIVLPSISPFFTIILCTVFQSIVLLDLWKIPSARLFNYALIYCMFCCFYFGFHVHEKAILQIWIPLTMTCLETVQEAKYYFVFSLVSSMSLLPLVFTFMDQITCWILCTLCSMINFLVLSTYLKVSLKERKISTLGLNPFFTPQQQKLGMFTLLISITLIGITLFIPKYPFLPLLLTSVLCSILMFILLIGTLFLYYKKRSIILSAYTSLSF